MHGSEFLKHIGEVAPAPIYLFKGGADLLIEEAWNRLAEKIVPPNARRFNGERISARDCAAQDVIARLSTLPMFGGRSLIMVRDADCWPKDQMDAMRSYLEKPSPTGCLVLVAGQKTPAKLESAIASTGIVVEFSAPSEKDAPRWLQDRAKRYGKKLSHQAAHVLVENVGSDLFRLERELEKLLAYVGERNTMEVDDVREAVSVQRSFSVFELLRYVSAGRSSQAIASLRKLIQAGELPLGILALLARQVRHLWQIKDSSERGEHPSRIAQQLKLYPAVVKGYMQQASLFSEEDLRLIHKRLRDADLALKRTGISPEIILESLVLGLCRRNSKPSTRQREK